MKSRLKYITIIIILVLASLYQSEYFKQLSVKTAQNIVDLYYASSTYIKDRVNEHFRQAYEIESLRKQNKELERSAALLSTFASQLNSLLMDKNSSYYSPSIKLVKALSYENLGDYNKIWLEFKDYNSSKIYGLIHQGKTAGIVVQKDGLPLALMQNDPKCIFSVYLGNDKIPGVATGNNDGILVKYIPQWLHPKVGDEVYTSGLDGIFFSAIPVGKVTKIKDDNLYKSAYVEPYTKLNIPTYLYVVKKER